MVGSHAAEGRLRAIPGAVAAAPPAQPRAWKTAAPGIRHQRPDLERHEKLLRQKTSVLMDLTRDVFLSSLYLSLGCFTDLQPQFLSLLVFFVAFLPFITFASFSRCLTVFPHPVLSLSRSCDLSRPSALHLHNTLPLSSLRYSTSSSTHIFATRRATSYPSPFSPTLTLPLSSLCYPTSFSLLLCHTACHLLRA